MIIQQATYGVSTGHALLQCSDHSFSKVFNDVAWLTDLPATCPYGIAWAPFFRMVRLDEWMLFIHTQPDDDAKRGGMVFSRAALIPIDQIATLNDLSVLAAELRKPWMLGEELPPISISQDYAGGAQTEVLPLTAAIAQLVMRDSSRPAVVFQQAELDDALFELWRRAPPEFRSKLTFGLGFSPGDLEQVVIICTPQELASRWSSAQIVGTGGGPDLDGHVATILGLPVINSAREFASRVSLPLDSAKAISIAIQAAELWNAEATPSNDVKLLRILAEGSLPSAAASEARALVAQRLGSAHGNWPLSVLMQMRNLDLESIEGAEGLRFGIQAWVTTQGLSSVHDGLLEIFLSWLSDKPRQPWKDSVEVGFSAAIANKQVSMSLFALIWQGIRKEPSRAQRALTLLHGPQHEKLLTACVDEALPADVADEILAAALLKEWWMLAGHVLAKSRSTVDALRAAVATTPSRKIARETLIRSAMGGARPIELVDAAIDVRNEIAIQMAAEAAEKDRSVFLSFDWKRYEWFQVFKGAYAISPDVIDSLPNRVQGMGQMVSAQMAAQKIWQVVADTPLADLSEIADRQRAWDLIPVELVDGILDITARSWLRRFEQGHASVAELEPRLDLAVSRIARRPEFVLEALRREPGSLPRFLTNFPFSTDTDALRFLTSIKGNDLRLAEGSSKALGQALLANKWSAAARGAVQWLHIRQDFYPMYRECLPLLSIIDQLWVAFELGLGSPLTMDEAWDAFVTEAAHLYPSGPWHNEIWSRCGGNNEDLFYEGSGKASWHRCLRDLRNGLTPGAEAVLDKMCDDFPNNNTLRQLQRQRFWR